MKTKSPGEIIICRGGLHRKHLVDSYKYPGENKNKSPGKIIIYHGGKKPRGIGSFTTRGSVPISHRKSPGGKTSKTLGEMSVSPRGDLIFFSCVLHQE